MSSLLFSLHITMKVINSILSFVLAFTFLNAVQARADWTQTNGPHAGWENPIAAGGNYFFAPTNRGLCRSSDKVDHWNLILNMPTSSVVVHDSTVFAGGYGNNMMLRSTDLGDHRLVVTGAGFDQFVTLIYSQNVLLGGLHSIVSLFANHDYLFAAPQSNGVWRRPLSELIMTEVQDQSTVVPVDFTLDQNYPDPFASTTTITYTLPRREHITLNIFDVMGELVETRADEEQQSGKHLVELSSSQLPPGVYFYQLSAPGFFGVKKMMVMR